MAEALEPATERRTLGYRIDGFDISQGLEPSDVDRITDALDRHSVICISGRPYGPTELIAFARQIGPLEINVARSFHHGSFPEVTVLSNQMTDGKPRGSDDAGQIWHTDMSYNRIPGRASVLHAHQVPHDAAGCALGDTAFRDCQAAYEALQPEMQARLDGLEAIHSFEWLWQQMLDRGSSRPAYTDTQRAQKPPVIHPVVLRHPWTGKKGLYVNRGLTQKILGLPENESQQLLNFLFDHVEDEKFGHRHKWRVGDTLIWDNCATIHLATGGYGRDKPREMIRTQILGAEDRYRRLNPGLGFAFAAERQP